jgi:PKHD-type hydroxylase
MKGEWCYFKSQLSNQYCDKILEIIKARPYSDATIGLGAGQIGSDNSFRRSKIRFSQKTDQELNFVFKDLWELAIWANNDWFNFHISKLDYIQVAEYDESYSGEYKKHVDVFWLNNDPTYHRKLSCIIQLTDPNEYEGCDLEFYDLVHYPNKQELRQRGTVIFFPSTIPHAATPITKGTRYSIAAWFDGPKWR